MKKIKDKSSCLTAVTSRNKKYTSRELLGTCDGDTRSYFTGYVAVCILTKASTRCPSFPRLPKSLHPSYVADK